MRGNDMTIFQFYPEGRIGKGLCDNAFHLQCFFFRQGSCFSLSTKMLANCAETAVVLQCNTPSFLQQFSCRYRGVWPVFKPDWRLAEGIEDPGKLRARYQGRAKTAQMA